jgi:hypothetical protein
MTSGAAAIAHYTAPPAACVDLDEQTPLVTGGRIAGVLHLGASPSTWREMLFEDETSAETGLWLGARRVPATTARIEAEQPQAGLWIDALQTLRRDTQVGLASDPELIWQRTINDTLFETLLAQWRVLAAGPQRDCPPDTLDDPEPESAPEAWHAFVALRSWLNLTDLETANLLGLGKKTAYGWRRTGRPPQPRLARRLYEAHAFVRQMVLIFGPSEAARLIHQGGDNSAASLIANNRVAEAEARFANLIYARPRRSDVPLDASQAGDEDGNQADKVDRTPLPGGRRRVRARHRA